MTEGNRRNGEEKIKAGHEVKLLAKAGNLW